MPQNSSTAHAMPKRIPLIPATAWAFIGYLLRHCPTRVKIYGITAFLAEMSASVADIFVTWSLGRMVGVLMASSPDIGNAIWEPMVYEFVLFACIFTARSVALRIREYCDRQYVPILLDTSRELLFSRLLQQSQAFVQNNFAGVLTNHVRRGGDVINALRENIQKSALPLITRFVTAGALLWALTPTLTIFIFISIFLCVISAVLTAPRWTSISVRNALAASRLSGYIVDSVSNLRSVQQNVGWREEKRRLGEAHADVTASYRSRLVYASWFWGFFDFAMIFFYIGFMGLVVYGWQTGDVTPAELGMAIGLVTSLFGTLAGTVTLLSTKFDDVGLLQESLTKISTPIAVIDRPGAPPLAVEGGEIVFRDVSFGYSDETALFAGLNLTIKPGQKVGLVGVSGAGKTTLCQLLLRAYDVTSGGIFIDGQNIADVTLDSLQGTIAIIPQEPMMFHRSLADNIAYGRTGVTRAEIEAAAEAAGAVEFITRLSDGYDTLVGERGVKLSGGQRQRVAIARAILRGAPILVLDEATSALDSETEAHIKRALITAMQGRTTIAIAHRLSTLSHMDRIIVMDQGQVIEDGTFAELQTAGGMFARLWSLQAGGFLPEVGAASTH